MTETPFERLRREVIDAGLCTRCGSCVGVCPAQTVHISDSLGSCLPVLRDPGPCADCVGPCLSGCSGVDVHFPTLAQFLYGRQPANRMLGVVRSLFVGHAADDELRRAGASGGVLSAAALYLLESGRVDGVIALGPHASEPWRFEPRIVRDRDGVLACAQSKYSISPVNTALRLLADAPPGEVFACVGIPCQVHSLRKLQAEGNPAAQRIAYVLGSYCGNILHFDAVRGFLSQHGVSSEREIARLEYRAGEWPGKMRVTLTSGRVLEMPKFYANYLIPFYMMRRCLLCTDLANELADISGGDAWAPVYEERGKGFSLIMGRTERGQRVIEEMIGSGRLITEPLEESFVLDMHSHMLDFKKRGAFIRISSLKARGKPVPRYGYEQIGPVPLGRRAFELFLQLVYVVCAWRLSRWAVARLPAGITGRLFQYARRRWKNLTSSARPRKAGSTLDFSIEPPRTWSSVVPPERIIAPAEKARG